MSESVDPDLMRTLVCQFFENTAAYNPEYAHGASGHVDNIPSFDWRKKYKHPMVKKNGHL